MNSRIRRPLYISLKSWLCCCSLPTVAPQQLQDQSVKIRSQVQIITRVFSLEINYRVYQIHQEGGVVNRFLALDDIFEPSGQNESIVWKTDSRFFFLSPHLTRPTGMWGSGTSRA